MKVFIRYKPVLYLTKTFVVETLYWTTSVLTFKAIAMGLCLISHFRFAFYEYLLPPDDSSFFFLCQSSVGSGDKQFFFDQGIIDAGRKRLKQQQQQQQQQQEGKQTGEVCAVCWTLDSF